jgi:alkanesulfonate monooxygenase SsuD/methylene tetrahydromethanopterin reductase-like flavin-dependent oxidoreductase (luciferase family)
MGSREQNFYNRLVSSYGFEREAQQVQELYLAGRKSEAMLALSDELIDAVSIAGSPQRAKERIRAFRDAGVDTLIVSPMAFDNDERKQQLHLVAELAKEAG